MTDRTGFGKRLTDAREAVGLTLAEASVYATQATGGSRRVSHSTIQRMEVGLIPEEHADAIIVGALSVVYGRNMETLSAHAAAKLSGYERLLAQLKAKPLTDLRHWEQAVG